MAADAIRARYQEYIDYVNELYEKASVFDGLFGTGAAPSKAPGHTEFYDSLEPLVEELLASGSPEDQKDAAFFMVAANHETEKACPNAAWMMMAAMRQALPFIERLSPDDAAALLAEFDSYYPKRLRFPVHKEVARVLKKQAAGRTAKAGKTAKAGLFGKK